MSIYNHKCTLCPLHKGAKTVCMEGDGGANWRAMIVGEAPGRTEDQLGKPFVGEAGKILDAALAISCVDAEARSQFFVTNVVKCRPPGNAKPTHMQKIACFEYLHKEIAANDPVAVLALGNTAIEVLLDTSGIARLRGQWRRLDRKRTTWVMPTYHPAYILRKGEESQEFIDFCSDVDVFVGKILSWADSGHPDDQKKV